MKSKKSAKQIRREVDDFLRSHAQGSSGTPRRHHATKVDQPYRPTLPWERVNEDQAAVLMVANDAALDGDFVQAAKVLKSGSARHLNVTTALRKEDEEDFADQAKRQIEISVTSADIKRHAGRDKPVTEAIVERTAKELLRAGKEGDDGLQASSDTWDENVWYYTMTSDYGDLIERSYFLDNFTEEEAQRIFASTNARLPTRVSSARR